MGGKTNAGGVAYMIFAQFAYGIAIGEAISICAPFLLRRFQFGAAGFSMIFVIGVALLAYGLPMLVGGNGRLAFTSSAS